MNPTGSLSVVSEPGAQRPSAPAETSLEQVADWLGDALLEVRHPRPVIGPLTVTGVTHQLAAGQSR